MDFEVVIVGTGLTESITAAALAKAGFKVAHIDNNDYYGGNDACLTLDEIVHWADLRANKLDNSDSLYLRSQRARFTSISHSPSVPPQPRQYSISLAPSIIPSTGPLISSLISSGVSRYGGFKLLDRIALYDKPGYVNSVPSTKEDIFKDKQISLVEKRRLMRFFTFAAGEYEGEPEIDGSEDIPLLDFLKTKFSLTDKVAETIAYALAFCTSASDPTLPALKRIRRYLRSSGRYGASPFLIGHYGGSGEIVQGFCRASAVNGSTYILGRTVLSLHSRSDAEASSLTSNQRQHNIVLQDFDENISCDLVITSPDYIQKAVDAKTNKTSALARCIAIIDQPLVFSPFKSDPQQGDPTSDGTDAFAVDTAVLIFPPSCLADYPNDTAVHAFVTGEGSMSAPKSRWILYLSMPVSSNDVSPEELLRPYLTATMSLMESSASAEALFTLFYIQGVDQLATAEHGSSQFVVPQVATLLPECVDAATEDAEVLFRKAITTLQVLRKQRQANDLEDPQLGESEEVLFWPPLEPDPEQMEDWQ